MSTLSAAELGAGTPREDPVITSANDATSEDLRVVELAVLAPSSSPSRIVAAARTGRRVIELAVRASSSSPSRIVAAARTGRRVPAARGDGRDAAAGVDTRERGVDDIGNTAVRRRVRARKCW
jgi:hypothetical protein